MDIDTSRYWTICIITNPINPNGRLTRGYKNQESDLAKEFFEENFPEESKQKTLSKEAHKNLQALLWKIFHNDNLDFKTRALAGLCLRCYISHAMAKTCTIVTGYAFTIDTPGPFTYHDLLPYILNDDGKTLIILDRDGKTQLTLKEDGSTQPVANKGNYQSVEILRTYNPKLSKTQSLDNWVIRCTQQNQELRNFLLEYKVRVPSDWSLLCKNIPNSLKSCLQNSDREILEVFHQVYRRDRRSSAQTGKCTEPTIKQLQEMLGSLRKRNIILNSHKELIVSLREIADVLRQDMYSRKLGAPQAESIDTPSQPDDNNYSSQVHLPPGGNLDPVSLEWQELLNILNKLFIKVLSEAIARRISNKISDLTNSRKYACFATKFSEGLQLYYRESNPLSIGQIADLWSIDKSQAQRIFKLKELIKATEYLSEEMMIQHLIKNPVDRRLTSISQSPEMLKAVAEAIRDYIYETAFKEAFAEINNGRYLSRNSLFAQLLRQYLNHRNAACSTNKLKSVTYHHINSGRHAESCNSKR